MINSYFIENSLQDLLEEIQYVYMSDERPWIIGYSGGKDSTVITHLVYTMLKQLFQLEDNPTDYQIAAEYFQRIRVICNNMITGTMFDNLHSNGLESYKNGLSTIELWTSSEFGAFSTTGFESALGRNVDLPQFDREAVKRVYPDLPVDEFEDALESWLTNGKIAIDSLNNGGSAGDEGKLADAALRDMMTYGRKIVEYYTARLKNQ